MNVQYSYCYCIFSFQHPFISQATDPKPILDLLAEFKAEIVEEEIMDINEDKEVSDQTSAKSLSKCAERDNADVRMGRWDADARLCINMHISFNFHISLHLAKF